MYFDDVFNTASFALLVGSFVRVISAPIIIGSNSVSVLKCNFSEFKVHHDVPDGHHRYDDVIIKVC